MALLDSEVVRLRYETGANVLTIGAEPRIDHLAIFEQVIQPYMSSGATTTSATAVTAATSPTPVAITLTSATGFSSGDRVVVDVDARQEVATIQSLVGAVATVQLSLAHSGTYPVTVEGGETIIRGILKQLDAIGSAVNGHLFTSGQTAGLKSVDEISWYGATGGSVGSGTSRTGELKAMRMYWRDELASALGIPNFWRMRSNGGGRSALY
jgi:hypothetical protein